MIYVYYYYQIKLLFSTNIDWVCQLGGRSVRQPIKYHSESDLLIHRQQNNTGNLAITFGYFFCVYAEFIWLSSLLFPFSQLLRIPFVVSRFRDYHPPAVEWAGRLERGRTRAGCGPTPLWLFLYCPGFSSRKEFRRRWNANARIHVRRKQSDVRSSIVQI